MKSKSGNVLKTIAIVVGFLFISLLLTTGCSRSSEDPSEPITIAAAASLELPLLEITDLFNEQYPDIIINTSFAGSRIIEDQIIRGAPIDLFLSASSQSAPILINEQITDPIAVKTLLTNSLVLVAPSESNLTISSLLELESAAIQTLGLGDPDSVPAGFYAKEALVYFDLWEELSEIILYTQNVRQVLTLLETNNIDAGFIYQTDFLSGRNIRKVLTVPPESHMDIIYQGMIIDQSRNEATDRAISLFFSFLETDTSRTIFEKYGFLFP